MWPITLVVSYDFILLGFIYQCQQEVSEILRGKILVGHALDNDLRVLQISHPTSMIRDTATYKLYMRVWGCIDSMFGPSRIDQTLLVMIYFSFSFYLEITA